MGMRAALYWAPAVDDPLARAGNAWLGRDAESGAMLRQPAIEGISAFTATARLYGFHATLRPPMRLATGWEEFCSAAASVAARRAPFDLPTLSVVNENGFLALCLSTPCPALHALANACIAETDRHRLQPDAAELAGRRAAGLSAEEDALLLRWGYPYVMQRWSFHVTLSCRLSDSDMARLLPIARAHFAPALGVPRRVRDICIFTQAGPHDGKAQNMLIAERLVLTGT
jgi:hypothetical protein